MDDYYELLGVDADASTDEIRTAYREKKAALESKGAGDDVARTNRAWNTLSDPYQRGRYDEQRARAAEDGTLGADDGADDRGSGAAAPATPARRRGLFQPAARERAPLTPTIALPEGVTLAPSNKRLSAMGIDLFVLVLLFMGGQFLVAPLQERWYPDEHARLEEITRDPAGDERSAIDELRDAADDADERFDEALTAVDEQVDAEVTADDLDTTCEGAEGALADACDEAIGLRADAKSAQQEYDELEDEYLDLSGTVAPASYLVIEATMLASLAYLVVPSARTGQTLGKRLRGVRVVHEDGTPIGWIGALKRYGLILLAVNLLLLIPMIGILGVVIVLVVVTGWMRNANQQALHDRLTKTIVANA